MKRYFLVVFSLFIVSFSGDKYASPCKDEDFFLDPCVIEQQKTFTPFTRVQLPSTLVTPSLEANIIECVQEEFFCNDERDDVMETYLCGDKMYLGPWFNNAGKITGPYFGTTEETQTSTVAPFNVFQSKFSDESRKISLKEGQKMMLCLVNRSSGYTVICSLYRKGNKDKLFEWKLSKGQSIPNEIIPVTEDGKYYVHVSAVNCDGSRNYTHGVYGMLRGIDVVLEGKPIE